MLLNISVAEVSSVYHEQRKKSKLKKLANATNKTEEIEVFLTYKEIQRVEVNHYGSGHPDKQEKRKTKEKMDSECD
uniref:Uncharacterized protein n=1 Tax=Arion vulgaris TaxID=1028688 RepID=A0A0B7B4Q2_9EUPU